MVRAQALEPDCLFPGQVTEPVCASVYSSVDWGSCFHGGSCEVLAHSVLSLVMHVKATRPHLSPVVSVL